jgi:surface antigen
MREITRLVLSVLIVLTIIAPAGFAGAEHQILTRAEFDLWPDYPEYTIFNPFPSKGRNCTWYAHGRMMQLGYCKYALDSMRFNAHTWAEHADRGALVTNVPVAGAIAFWDSGAFFGHLLGHVGVVETVREDGSIIVSDSSSSASAYRVYPILPGEGKWPTAFITVPPARTRSSQFLPGQLVRVTANGLNFRLEGVNQPTVQLPKGATAIIKKHPSNGLYASQPGSITAYHHWWYAAVKVEGELKYGWLAQTYLEFAGVGDEVPDPEPAPDPALTQDPESNPNTNPDPERESKPVGMPGDVTGDGMVDIRDVSMVMQKVIGIIDLSDEQTAAADVNNDGIIDVRDVTLIMRYSLGYISSF